MNYYEVDVLASKGGDKATFTYQADSALNPGSLVKVSFGAQSSLGVVRAKVSKPIFKTKPISKPLDLPPLPLTHLELADWLAHYYAAPLARVWQTILPQASLVKPCPAVDSTSQAPAQPPEIKLTAQQKLAISQISSGKNQNYLLFGATGSGKTQVYIELAKKALAAGKSVIVLVPEIALTAQITQTLNINFGSQVVLTHSGLTPAQRRDEWLKVLTSSRPQVIVGPRSALFMPVKKLGYIFIDEAHDNSYKQDQSPRYQTHQAASHLAGLTKAKVVMGTATPSVNSMYLAKVGQLNLVQMSKPIFSAQPRQLQIVNLRDKTQLSSSYILSKSLVKQLEHTLAGGKQSLLFLNRRGSARVLLCQACNWRADCPNCQIPLTWHGDLGRLRCHWCGYHAQPPAACPQCQSLDIKFIGSGTKRLEAEISKILPQARIARLDKDSFEPRSIAALYRKLTSGKIDILLGTQMITKGLDLAGVETVGVVLADNMLYVPDFSATEQAFQLLYQVSGRAGRREGSISNVIIQTYSPKHPAILAAAERNYNKFYKYEIAERKALNYPPFSHLLKIWVTKPSRPAAQKSAQTLFAQLNDTKSIELIGPSPAWMETYGGNYRWQIIIKAMHRPQLLKITQNLPVGWTHDIDPVDLL